MTPDLSPIASALSEEFGLDPDVIGARALSLAVRTRVRALGLPDARSYLAAFTTRRAERRALLEELVVPETWFFRESAAFAVLAEHALACRARGEGSIRVACLACATGEEPYSVAITLLDSGLSEFQVDAVDVSESAVRRARRAVYARRSVREAAVPEAHRVDRAHGFELAPAVRERVSFRVGNVADPALLSGEAGYHAVFCRNVLIYLTRQARQRCLATLARLLAPGGILFTGNSEDPRSLDASWRPRGPGESFAYTRDEPAPGRPAGSLSLPLARDVSTTPPPPASRTSGPPAPPAPSSPGEATRSLSPRVPGREEIRSLADRGRLAEALAACGERLDSIGPEAPTLFLRAVILGALGEDARAEEGFLGTLCLDEAHEGALTHLALLAERRGDRVRAAGFRRRANALRRGAA